MQLARLAGVGHIVATCTPSALAYVEHKLGAHEVLDYQREEGDLTRWPASRPKFHAVIDCVGGDALAAAWTVVREWGTLLSVVTKPTDVKPSSKGKGKAEDDRKIPVKRGDVEAHIQTIFFMHKMGTSFQIEHITNLLASGRVRPFVRRVYDLEDYEAAVADAYSGHGLGKVVLKVNQADPRPVIYLLKKHGSISDRDATDIRLEKTSGAGECDEDAMVEDDYDYESSSEEEEDYEKWLEEINTPPAKYRNSSDVSMLDYDFGDQVPREKKDLPAKPRSLHEPMEEPQATKESEPMKQLKHTTEPEWRQWLCRSRDMIVSAENTFESAVSTMKRSASAIQRAKAYIETAAALADTLTDPGARVADTGRGFGKDGHNVGKHR